MRSALPIAILLLGASYQSHAAEFYPTVLPPEAIVRSALEALPQVSAAREGIRLQQAYRSRLESGNYEWSARAAVQQRREATGPRYMEKELLIERPVRWFGKSDKDAALGMQGESMARFALADAWHEAGRGLLKAWFDWVREAAAAQRLGEQVRLLEQQIGFTRKRIAAGDAPRVEIMLAEAERDRIAAQQLQATQRANAAQVELKFRYPGVAMLDGPPLPLPRPADGADEEWLARILGDNHELELARAEVQYARIQSERLALERTADPTIGIRMAQERGQQEKLIGVLVSIPFGGHWRTAQYEAGIAQAAIAAERQRQVDVKVHSDSARAVNASRTTYDIWGRLDNVSRQTSANAALVVKGYSLGESSLIEVLQVRRQSTDAVLAAQTAQVDALEAYARLLLDAHEIWKFDHDQHR